MDNASYHSSKIEECTPKWDWRKADLITWLDANEVSYDKDANKKVLWKIAREKSLDQPRYKVDEIIRAHGHEVLRLPPYHCELNAIERI